MKKALVILILLAFVGGGLFAQTVNIQGQFETGIAVIMEEAEDDPRFGLVAPTAIQNGVRTQLLFTYTNAEGNAGFLARLRANPMPASGIDTAHRSYGWAKFGDGMVEARGGLYETTLATYTFDGEDFARTGVIALINPSDTLTIGAGGFAAGPLPGADWEAGGLGIWGGLGVNMPGVMGLRAQLTFQEEDIQAQVSANISAVADFPILATAKFWNLNDFGDTGELWAHVNVGIGVIDNMNLNLAGTLGMSMDDDDDLFIAGGAWLTYPMGDVVPGLHAYFVMGGTYNYNGFGLNPRFSVHRWSSASYNTDHLYVTAMPNVQFRVNNNCWFDLGAIVNFDLGDDAAAGGEGLSFGAYAAVRVNF